MFPVKEVIHPMEVRKCEKFEVNYANTGRLTDSAIPYMQRILNNDNLNQKGAESKRKVLHQEENPPTCLQNPNIRKVKLPFHG